MNIKSSLIRMMAFFLCASSISACGNVQSVKVDLCADNNGDCGPSEFYLCTGGFEAEATCVAIDVCASNNGECGPESAFTCMNNPGASPTCTDIDECALETDNCGDNSSCSNLEGSFECVCNEGFDGDGFSCEDIDDCSLETSPCDIHATCANTIGSFECECNEGFTGTGIECSDIDECLNEDTNSCVNNAICTNEPGGYSCACKPGFNGLGRDLCTAINECAEGLDDCPEDSLCVDHTPGLGLYCNDANALGKCPDGCREAVAIYDEWCNEGINWDEQCANHINSCDANEAVEQLVPHCTQILEACATEDLFTCKCSGEEEIMFNGECQEAGLPAGDLLITDGQQQIDGPWQTHGLVNSEWGTWIENSEGFFLFGSNHDLSFDMCGEWGMLSRTFIMPPSLETLKRSLRIELFADNPCASAEGVGCYGQAMALNLNGVEYDLAKHVVPGPGMGNQGAVDQSWPFPIFTLPNSLADETVVTAEICIPMSAYGVENTIQIYPKNSSIIGKCVSQFLSAKYKIEQVYTAENECDMEELAYLYHSSPIPNGDFEKALGQGPDIFQWEFISPPLSETVSATVNDGRLHLLTTSPESMNWAFIKLPLPTAPIDRELVGTGISFDIAAEEGDFVWTEIRSMPSTSHGSVRSLASSTFDGIGEAPEQMITKTLCVPPFADGTEVSLLFALSASGVDTGEPSDYHFSAFIDNIRFVSTPECRGLGVRDPSFDIQGENPNVATWSKNLSATIVSGENHHGSLAVTAPCEKARLGTALRIPPATEQAGPRLVFNYQTLKGQNLTGIETKFRITDTFQTGPNIPQEPFPGDYYWLLDDAFVSEDLDSEEQWASNQAFCLPPRYGGQSARLEFFVQAGSQQGCQELEELETPIVLNVDDVILDLHPECPGVPLAP